MTEPVLTTAEAAEQLRRSSILRGVRILLTGPLGQINGVSLHECRFISRRDTDPPPLAEIDAFCEWLFGGPVHHVRITKCTFDFQDAP